MQSSRTAQNSPGLLFSGIVLVSIGLLWSRTGSPATVNWKFCTCPLTRHFLIPRRIFFFQLRWVWLDIFPSALPEKTLLWCWWDPLARPHQAAGSISPLVSISVLLCLVLYYLLYFCFNLHCKKHDCNVMISNWVFPFFFVLKMFLLSNWMQFFLIA